MEPKKYSCASLRAMCGRQSVKEVLPWHDLKDDGLWLAERERFIAFNEREVMEWHPRRNSKVPALPVPFSAYELAAFFLAGGGTFLHDVFDDGDSLDEAALAALGSNADDEREVLREAHRLYLEANSRFGRDDEGVRKAAEWLLNDAPVAAVRETAPCRHVRLLEWFEFEVEAAGEYGALERVTDPAPVQRAAAQDAALISSLRAAKHDPLALPKNVRGKPGVKAATRVALGNGGLWAGSTVFEKAWERLTRNGDIAYKA